MIFPSGYQILHQLYEGTNSQIYRGIRESDGQKVIIKVLKKDYTTISELDHYKREYKITKSLNIDSVIKLYSLEKYQNTLAIISEDFEAKSLKILLNNRSFSIAEFLKIAIKTVKSLEQIHDANVIHKDLNSHNILYNPDSEELKINNFGISALLNKENHSRENLDILEEKLAYISPEQTGRTGRSLDYRTDFYSLGVTFYELLMEQLPFESTNPLELIHCHLAKQAIPPSHFNPSIPIIISDLVMKLMAKNPDDRYQSAWGLKADLEHCLQQLELTGVINHFPLASQDISDKFLISEKLYGRDEIFTTLLSQWQRVADQSSAEITTIAGYSGIGKSSLANIIEKKVSQEKGYFILGKFDQFQRDIPYSALIRAFQQLVIKKLKENKEKINYWKNKLLANLGNNGQIIIDVIPEIELIIGKQPPVPELSGNEAYNRFNLIFQKFMEVCCTKEHPLVIFLDDLQWGDRATFKLIELIMLDNNLQHLLVMGAYRSNEIDQDHPLMTMIDNVKKNEGIVNQIYLQNLTLDDVNNLIADTLKSDIDQVKSLAELVFKKTLGNPLLTKQFLQTLYLENLIRFDYSQRKWQWDVTNISAQNITDNVLELMINQLKTFSKSTQSLLQLSACIGNNFSLSTLSIIEQKSPQTLLQDLMIPLNYGLILPLASSSQGLIDNYQFLHDLVQQAAYALIPESEKPQIHLTIGELLLEKYSDLEREKKLFDIVGHLNKGRKLINESKVKENLAKLNLQAGNRAKNANAYKEAGIYLRTGLELLNPNCWETQYQLSLELYTSNAETAYLKGDFQEMDTMAQQVLNHARIILDRVVIYKVSIAAEIAQSNIYSSITIGRKALEELGIELPTQANSHEINNAMGNLNNQLEDKKIEELIDLPINNNPKAQATLEILAMLYPAFFQAMPDLLPLVSSTMVSLSLKFGNLPASAVGYCIHGMVLCSFFGEVEKAYNFGCLAMDLIKRDPQQCLKHLAIQIFGCIIQPRKTAIRRSLTTLQNSYQVGLETGDLMNASYSSLVYSFTGFFAGMELETLELELNNYSSVLTQLRQDSAKVYLDMIGQTIKNLRETTSQPDCLMGTLYNETIRIPQHNTNQELTAIAQVYIYKLLLGYCFGNYQSAQHYINQAQPFLVSVAGLVFFPLYHFYSALTYIALWETQENQVKILEEVEHHQEILHQWAKNAPMNYLGKWHLVEAEKQRILGNKAEAIDNYDQAIELAKENEFIHEQAMANELAGKFYLGWGKEKLAHNYLQESFYHYGLWGATAKIADLEQKYPQFFASSISSPDPYQEKLSTSVNFHNNLDLITVMKSSQAIAGEVVLENLLQTLMEILLENAGVQTGCLLIHTPNLSGELGTFTIAIDSRNQTHNLYPQKKISESIPESILKYVADTRKHICLDRPYLGGDFIDDPYIQSVKPFSILCYPLINQGNLEGVIYLENNLTMGVFTISNIEFLQLLSGQAVIALRNAQLYSEIKHKEELLKQFLEAMPIGISVLDAKGRPYYTNHKAESIFGKGVIPAGVLKEEIGEVYRAYIAGTNQLYPNENLPVIRALQGEICNTNDVEIRNGDNIIPIESWGTPIYDQSGRIQYAMVAFQDITQRKETEKILRNYNHTLEKEILSRTAKLQQANEQLSRLANLDGLTQVANRRRFDDYLKLEWQRHLRQQQPLSLILIDIDYFKLYNDSCGHQQGDDCLIRVARAISEVIQRPTDLFARYGGEEFALVLPETPSQGALIVAQSIKNMIAQIKIPHPQSRVNEYVTLSMGVGTVIPFPQLAPEDLIAQVDEALYRAKKEGRNRIIMTNK